MTNFNFDKIIIETIERVHAYSRSDSRLLYMMDEIKNGTFEHSGDTIYAEGNRGVKLSAFDRNKAVKFTCTNGYVVASALASQLGTEVETASDDNKFVVKAVEYLTTTDGTTVTLNNTPVTGSVKYIYKANTDNTQGQGYSVGATSGADAFSITGSKITLPTGAFNAGDVVIATYDREVSVGKQIDNVADKSVDDVYFVVDMLGHDPCTDETFLVQAIMPKAHMSGTFSLEIGENPAEHNLEVDSLLDPCSTDKKLYRIVIAA